LSEPGDLGGSRGLCESDAAAVERLERDRSHQAVVSCTERLTPALKQA
jgi:hypothetical protein